jgi:hypothetical protein
MCTSDIDIRIDGLHPKDSAGKPLSGWVDPPIVPLWRWHRLSLEVKEG